MVLCTPQTPKASPGAAGRDGCDGWRNGATIIVKSKHMRGAAGAVAGSPLVPQAGSSGTKVGGLTCISDLYFPFSDVFPLSAILFSGFRNRAPRAVDSPPPGYTFGVDGGRASLSFLVLCLVPIKPHCALWHAGTEMQ